MCGAGRETRGQVLSVVVPHQHGASRTQIVPAQLYTAAEHLHSGKTRKNREAGEPEQTHGGGAEQRLPGASTTEPGGNVPSPAAPSPHVDTHTLSGLKPPSGRDRVVILHVIVLWFWGLLWRMMGCARAATAQIVSIISHTSSSSI